jgi:hypothetical protein
MNKFLNPFFNNHSNNYKSTNKSIITVNRPQLVVAIISFVSLYALFISIYSYVSIYKEFNYSLSNQPFRAAATSDQHGILTII